MERRADANKGDLQRCNLGAVGSSRSGPWTSRRHGTTGEGRRSYLSCGPRSQQASRVSCFHASGSVSGIETSSLEPVKNRSGDEASFNRIVNRVDEFPGIIPLKLENSATIERRVREASLLDGIKRSATAHGAHPIQ